MKTIFIDGTSLCFPVLKSIANILENTLPLLSKTYKIVLILPKEIDKSYIQQLGISDVVFNSGLNSDNFSIVDFIFRYLPGTRQIIRKYNPDFFWNPLSYYPFQRINSKTKFITMIHDLFTLHPVSKRSFLKKIIFKKLIGDTLKNVDGVIVPSAFTLASLELFFPKEIKKTRVKVIYNGISLPSHSSSYAEYQKPQDDYILFIGRLSYWKGTDILLDLYDRYNYNRYKLVLAGVIDDRAIEIKLKKVLQTNPNVIYKGFISDSEKEMLYKNARLFIYPSRYDGFGLPPLEAAIRKTPVIMSNIPVLYEITHGKGLYFDVRTGVSDLLQILESVDDTTLKKTAEELYKVARGYSWKTFVENFVDFTNRI
ncbi:MULTISPECIES: glycosyltransferase family 1 protein [unclassified Thermotoga]|jgi:glycosyltransferase involved in cell wall biosynthesis|uniref:glycosyltransferase family 4 protein n=1 Tax=unclassified Thermotoga TaxID=2631113 RepID=UPI000280E6BC|nr:MULTISPECIES: glycosyltransferase family 1 protein [unclassified Thermotoga]AIY85854.1 group 1 glycosyl transferase [Thermotoga sp. 2812B]EJX26860.1 group 1 glycosyl transferase [Thermotoga sp. EMP]KHC90355.1 group 1 glycosyl transferase [Thermotoga sp. Mc24]